MTDNEKAAWRLLQAKEDLADACCWKNIALPLREALALELAIADAAKALGADLLEKVRLPML